MGCHLSKAERVAKLELSGHDVAQIFSSPASASDGFRYTYSEVHQSEPQAKQLQYTADQRLLFDATCHYLTYRQETEGLDALLSAMKEVGVGFAALTGCPFKKAWMSSEEPLPEHHLYDDGDLYYYSMTDAILHRHLQTASPATASHFAMLACGFNLGDAGAGAEAELLIREFPVVGFGELTLQSDDVNNMTIKGGNWTFSDPSVRALLDVAASQDVSHMEAENPSRASDVARKGSALSGRM